MDEGRADVSSALETDKRFLVQDEHDSGETFQWRHHLTHLDVSLDNSSDYYNLQGKDYMNDDLMAVHLSSLVGHNVSCLASSLDVEGLNDAVVA